MAQILSLPVTHEDLRRIQELALGHAKQMRELFGDRLVEFPVVEQEIMALGQLSQRAQALAAGTGVAA